MPEQDKKADMQTRQNMKLKAHGNNDPQLHRPQQVSIRDGLMGGGGITECVRGGARQQHETKPGPAQTSASSSVKTHTCYR